MSDTECSHEKTEVRRRVDGLGNSNYARQCLRCGRHCGAVPKGMAAMAGYNTPWDTELEKRWSQHVKEKLAERRWLEKEMADQGWRLKYEAHLKSDAWKELCRKVRERCNGVCEGCGKAPMAHTHHMTYVNLGNEFLWELRGVCLDCHKRIHPHMEAG